MSSILTNNSAMVALQTLKSINMNLGKVQSEISTGKTVESAKDNAATWAISKVMQSDVAGFEAISDSLALGSSTVGVALNAAESITDLLTEIKGKVVNSQEANVDREKIQADIEALTNQIGSIAGAAQFNGLNLLSNSDVADAGSGTVDVLSSLDRSATGVTASDISVGKQDLGIAQAVLGTAGGAAGPVSAAAANVAVGATVTAFTVDADLASVGSTIAISTGGGGTALTGTDRIVVGVREGDTIQSVAQNVVTALNFATEATGGSGVYSLSATTAGLIEFTNDNPTGGDTPSLTATDVISYETTDPTAAAFDGEVGGSLSLLSKFDVSTADGATAALSAIEDLIQTSVDSAAALGSTGKRIETQADFVGKLIDGLTSGIGSLVDADMEAASAKLQALQTQQQLGVQALSIANQAPQTILSLFR